MKFKMIAMIAVAIFAVGSTGTSASAQGCGCGGHTGAVPGNFGSYGGFDGIGMTESCGRGISSSQASSLWSGYCTESCAYTGPRREGLFGCCKSRHGGGCGGGCLGGSGSCFGGCGFNQGCFGYPSCGCGCGSSIGSYGKSCGGGCGGCGKRHGGCGKRHGGCGKLHGGCGLKAKLAGLRPEYGPNIGGGFGAGHSSCGRGGCLSGGCGVKGCFFNKMLARHTANSYIGFASVDASSSCSYLTSGCDTCGTGGYFNEAVGYDYGNGGMQSYVSGSLTGACGCGQ